MCRIELAQLTVLWPSQFDRLYRRTRVKYDTKDKGRKEGAAILKVKGTRTRTVSYFASPWLTLGTAPGIVSPALIRMARTQLRLLVIRDFVKLQHCNLTITHHA